MTLFSILINRLVRVGVAGAMFFALVGCAGYDLEVDAPILNKVGLVGDSKKNSIPIKERAPLVVPPTAQLPQPGVVAKAPPEDLNWPDDPDLRAKKIAELKAKQQEALDKKKGPWHKALNSMIGSDGDEQQQGENPVPSQGESSEGGTFGDLASGASSGGQSNTDMEQRVEDMIR